MQKVILDNLNTAVIVMGQNLRILTLNPAAEALLDTSVKRVQPLPVTTVIPQDDLQADLNRALTQGQQYTRRETDFPINGEVMTVDCSVSPITGDKAQLQLEIHPRDRLQRITREESLIARSLSDLCFRA